MTRAKGANLGNSSLCQCQGFVLEKWLCAQHEPFPARDLNAAGC